MGSPSKWSSRTVLVTGIGGFIGSGLAAGLVDAGADVVGVVRDSPGQRVLAELGLADRCALVSGDINAPGLVERAIGEYGVDTVFHLAAQSQVGVANTNPVSTFESNIAGTWAVLEACRRAPGVERVVVASSDKAYGSAEVLPYTEDTPLHGQFPYDASKVCADVLARSYGASFGLPIVVSRSANVYGPGDTNWARLVPGTIRSVLGAESPVIRSDGTPERDYLYLDDAVEGYLALADRAQAFPGEAFNFGTGTPISTLGLVTTIIERAGADLEPDVWGTATNEIDAQALACAKAHEHLGWSPRTRLEDGIDATIAWYRDHLDHPGPAR